MADGSKTRRWLRWPTSNKATVVISVTAHRGPVSERLQWSLGRFSRDPVARSASKRYAAPPPDGTLIPLVLATR